MANTQKKTSPIVWYAIGALTLGAIYYSTSGDAPAPTAKKTKRAPVSTAKKDDFLPEDYTANFGLLARSDRNAFTPLVVRKDGNSVVPTIDGGIPSAFADGDGNWQYKGFATVNGVFQALLENQNTGEGIFVKSGERWKSSRVLTITRDSIVMQGTSGAARSIPIISEDGGSSGPMAGLTPLPVPNPLTGGAIGTSPMSDTGAPGNRRGRNRGGGGGGGGFNGAGGGNADFSSFGGSSTTITSAPAVAAPAQGFVIGQ